VSFNYFNAVNSSEKSGLASRISTVHSPEVSVPRSQQKVAGYGPEPHEANLRPLILILGCVLILIFHVCIYRESNFSSQAFRTKCLHLSCLPFVKHESLFNHNPSILGKTANSASRNIYVPVEIHIFKKLNMNR
jgi:hypothetical protein